MHTFGAQLWAKIRRTKSRNRPQNQCWRGLPEGIIIGDVLMRAVIRLPAMAGEYFPRSA
ncbi:Uncharacterised protein [Bordetella pertussis]|nr:Uncharacterised protein [Bordetella pertussis]